MKFIQRAMFAAVFLLAAAFVNAEVKLPAIFGSNMVLQRGVEAPIWGTASPNDKILVKFRDKTISATAGADGKWKTALPATPAGGPHEITVTGGHGESIAFTNVMFGEVWVCSGQSNMEMSVGSSDGAQEAIASAQFPQIRLFTVKKKAIGTPQPDCEGKWEECSPKNVGGFSGVGFYFGVDLYKSLNIPIGLIHTSWGGTPAEAWATRESMEKMENVTPLLAKWDKLTGEFNEEKAKEDHQQKLKAWEEAAEKAKAENKKAPNRPGFKDPRTEPHRPASLYNGMIAPLVPYAIAGAIWYQGESNVSRAQQYRTLFPGMIQSWRTAWNMPSMPFYFVQIAPFTYTNRKLDSSTYAELCESQLLTMKKLPNTGMAVIHDVGNTKDIHPRNKKSVGQRLALWALAKTYDKKEVVFSGPIYKEMKVEGDKIRVRFDHIGGGLASRDGNELTHFTIAGEDQKFEDAVAKIDGNTVVVSSEKVTKPVAVRFSWHETAEPNLMNKEGLPASLFRTDDWKMATDGKNQ